MCPAAFLSHGTGVRIPVAVPSFAPGTRRRRMSTIARGEFSASDGGPLTTLAPSYGWQAKHSYNHLLAVRRPVSAVGVTTLVGILCIAITNLRDLTPVSDRQDACSLRGYREAVRVHHPK
jgi:hypothetical protein